MVTDKSDPKVIVALDYASREDALALVSRLNPQLCRLKVGLELYGSAGPDLVRELVGLGYGVFLDLKFHDIPHTVAMACKAAARLGVWMLNVHACGGPVMLQAAREALAECDHRPKLIAVTVLTSMDEAQLHSVGVGSEVAEQVVSLASLAAQSGLDGVVCSARESARLKAHFGNGFLCVTPGIRPQGSATDDQKRVMTPAQALAAGSDYLVIGRPITRAADPLGALQAIQEELGSY